jgi:translation initiation factor 1
MPPGRRTFGERELLIVKPKHTFRGVVMRGGPSRSKTVSLPSAAPPSQARVRVGREVAGRGGKGVSVISGLPLGATGLDELATRLKKLCGAGGAVKDGAIEIQGDHRDRLVAELQKLGYDAKRSGG